jgi:hypothetical protein
MSRENVYNKRVEARAKNERAKQELKVSSLPFHGFFLLFFCVFCVFCVLEDIVIVFFYGGVAKKKKTMAMCCRLLTQDCR